MLNGFQNSPSSFLVIFIAQSLIAAELMTTKGTKINTPLFDEHQDIMKTQAQRKVLLVFISTLINHTTNNHIEYITNK